MLLGMCDAVSALSLDLAGTGATYPFGSDIVLSVFTTDTLTPAVCKDWDFWYVEYAVSSWHVNGHWLMDHSGGMGSSSGFRIESLLGDGMYVLGDNAVKVDTYVYLEGDRRDADGYSFSRQAAQLYFTNTGTFTTTSTDPAPEPATIFLLGSGVAGLIAAGRRKQA